MTLGRPIAFATTCLITIAHIFIEHAIGQIASGPTWDGSSGISSFILVFIWCSLLVLQTTVALYLFFSTRSSNRRLAMCFQTPLFLSLGTAALFLLGYRF